MSDHEDIIMRDTKRDIPAVPKPDWSIDNFKTMAPLTQKIDDMTSGNESSTYIDMKKTSATANSSTAVAETSQKINRAAMVENGSTSSILSHNVDVPSTPIFNSVNPHSTMTAATPAPASGVNQAINSIKLQNCVSTVNVGCELQLLDIYCKTRYSEYNPRRFQGVVMKLMDPRATALIFRSGKIVCTGARNEYDSYIAARKFARVIERLGFPAKFLDFKIQNFCATADLKFPIRLEALQQAHGQFASYEPELFPGLVYRMVRPRVVLLIFVNGKIVFTGGKNRNEITEALEIIYPILRGYRIS